MYVCKFVQAYVCVCLCACAFVYILSKLCNFLLQKNVKNTCVCVCLFVSMCEFMYVYTFVCMHVLVNVATSRMQ